MEDERRQRLAELVSRDRFDHLSEIHETPHGRLYRPKTFGIQVLVLVAAFAGGPLIGWLVAGFLGEHSGFAEFLCYAPPILAFFFGYALWSARLAAIAFDMVGRHILWALLKFLVTRRRPQKLEDVLPDVDKLERMAVRAQKAASSFFVVAIPIAAVAGPLSFLAQSEQGALFRLTAIAGAPLVWGYVLSRLARRGYLPLPEPEG